MKKLTILLLIILLSGCSSFHSHQWGEPNYQQPSTCSICGETRGLPLEADFDSYEITGFISNGEAVRYVTCCDEEDLPAEGVFTVVSHDIISSNEALNAVTGYKWHIVTMTIDINDINSNEYGFLYNF